MAPPTILEAVGAGPKQPTTLENAALVVIDLQNEYTASGKQPLDNYENVLSNAAKLIDRARKANVPIIHVAHHASDNLFNTKDKSGQICDQVKPLDSEPVVTKNYVSSFVNTNMVDLLEKTGKKDLIVIGAMTHMCVSTFVRAAVEQYGYQCTVPADTVATKDLVGSDGKVIPASEVHKSHLAALSDYFAAVVPTSDEIKEK